MLYIGCCCAIVSAKPATRPYSMRRRHVAVARTRSAIIDAVHALLNAPRSSALTLEEVARAAGVTRVTVYNQFGSRRAVLLAAFADQGRLIGYDRVVAATALPDPGRALQTTLNEVCRAWNVIPRAIQRVLALAVLDPEIGAVVNRFEGARRAQMASLAVRLDAPVGAAAAASILGALTHPQTYFQFRVDAGPEAVARRLEHVALTALGVSRQAEPAS
jgi:AcrR family transcriptional regulator